MAKQVGLFSLRGKIENKSFYKTAGVPETVIRGIPEGLSSRVKTADEYANTRLNNAEFKTANSLATFSFRAVPQRKKGMMRRFAIADMTKKALEDIKQGTGDWGVRLPATELDVLIADMLENYAKGGQYVGQYGDFDFESVSAEGVITGALILPAILQNQLIAEGINGMVVVPVRGLAGEKVVDGEVRLFAGSNIGTPTSIMFNGTTDIEQTFTLSVATPTSVGMSQSGYEFAQEDTKHGFFAVLALLPFRTEGSKIYSLQERCTYVAFACGQIPE